MKATDIPLPKSWPENVKSATLHVLSLAHTANTITRSWCANSAIERVRLKEKVSQLEQRSPARTSHTHYA